MGDVDFWLSDEQLSHDLYLILLHSVWDSEWIPYGWYWDSCAAFFSGGGLVKAGGCLETEAIPLDIVGERLSIRFWAWPTQRILKGASSSKGGWSIRLHREF